MAMALTTVITFLLESYIYNIFILHNTDSKKYNIVIVRYFYVHIICI